MPPNVHDILRDGVERTDAALDRLLPSIDTPPVSLHRAMRHSVFAGGKRLRPNLCMEAARMVLGTGELPLGVEDLGSAIEMLHTYSLIHDDLPALDDDDLRRGKPTCHVVYGEAIAILAGDALQNQAYEVLASLQCPPAAAIRIVREVAIGTGTGVSAERPGMIGGQVMDIEGEEQKPTPDLVRSIHRAKTGALITVSLVTGGLYALGVLDGDGFESSNPIRGQATEPQSDANAFQRDTIARLRSFGQKAGLAFQIVDDVLDVTQNSEQLGKTAGKDTASEKATWPAVFGLVQSQRDADELIAAAFAELAPFGESAEPLKSLARYLVERRH